MAKLKISFNPIFIIFAFIVIYFDWLNAFLVYVGVLLLHELAHYFAAKLLGYKLNKIVFMPYGAGLSGQSNIFEPKHEIIIALAGPLLNIFLVLCCVALWWVEPITYAYSYLFMEANLVLGVFNLLPIFPLDGGRVVVAYFGDKTSKYKLYGIMKVVGIACSIVFCFMFVLSVFSKLNLTLFFIAVFLFVSSFTNVSDVYYERSYIKNFKNNKTLLKPFEVKTYAVSKDINIFKLVKYVKGNNFTQFLVLDEKAKVVKTLNEVELFKLLSENKKDNIKHKSLN